MRQKQTQPNQTAMESEPLNKKRRYLMLGAFSILFLLQKKPLRTLSAVPFTKKSVLGVIFKPVVGLSQLFLKFVFFRRR